MKPLVLYSPSQDQIGEAIPLFYHHHEESLGNLEGYSLSLSNNKPVGYIVFVDEKSDGVFVSAELVSKKLKDKTIIDLEAELTPLSGGDNSVKAK